MRKNPQTMSSRAKFVEKAIETPQEAADALQLKVNELREAKSSKQTTLILQEVLFVSESTIYKDLEKGVSN